VSTSQRSHTHPSHLASSHADAYSTRVAGGFFKALQVLLVAVLALALRSVAWRYASARKREGEAQERFAHVEVELWARTRESKGAYMQRTGDHLGPNQPSVLQTIAWAQPHLLHHRGPKPPPQERAAPWLPVCVGQSTLPELAGPGRPAGQPVVRRLPCQSSAAQREGGLCGSSTMRSPLSASPRGSKRAPLAHHELH